MSSVNKVILLGRLGKDPELRVTPNGNNLANLSVATSETWKDKNSGEKKEKTEWHRVLIFGKLADIAGKYLKKGSQVYLEGKMQTRKWQDDNGSDRYSTEVVLDVYGTLRMLGEAKQTDQSSSQEYRRQSGGSYVSNQPRNNNQASSNQPIIEDFDDDIPF